MTSPAPGILFQNLHKLEVRGRGHESAVSTEEEEASMTAAVDDTSQRLVTEKESPQLEYVLSVNQMSSHLALGLSSLCLLDRNSF